MLFKTMRYVDKIYPCRHFPLWSVTRTVASVKVTPTSVSNVTFVIVNAQIKNQRTYKAWLYKLLPN